MKGLEDLGNVSETEVLLMKQLVFKMRQEDALKAKQKAIRLKVLRVAHEYEAWLQEEGVSSSFSTFINTFGYQESDGKQLYELVTHVLSAATPSR